jgi:hypothetical protein
MIHRAKVQYSNSATGEIQVIIPSVTSKTGTVPITMWGRESHAANSKWLVPAVGDTIVVCREDEDYTNVFWLNTTVPPDPPYTFVDTPGVDGDKTTHFGTVLQVETGTTGQVRINTSTNVGGAALVVQPWGTEGTGLYVNPSNNATTNRAAIQLGSSIRMGTGNTSSTLGDWYIYDQTATKYNLYHTGHSNTTTGGLTITATGTHATSPAGTFTRNLWINPSYDSGGYEYCYITSDIDTSRSYYFNRHCRWGGTIYPLTDNAYDLGTTGYRWQDIHLVNNPTVGSDQNRKTDIADSDLGLDFVNALRPVSFKWIDRGGGDAGVRTHYGLLAQEVESTLGAAAPTTAIWTKTAVPASDATETTYNDNGTILMEGQPAVEEHEEHSLRYDELISPMIKAIQELTTRLAALESA